MDLLMKFGNKSIEVFELNGQVLFNPYHCGECLGLGESLIRDNLRKMNNKQVLKLNNEGENFLTEVEVYELISKYNKEEAEKFQDWVKDEVLPGIKKINGYISIDEEESCRDILAKTLNTLKERDELLKNKCKELEDNNKILNQLTVSKNTLLVREVAKIVSKENIKIGERRLWEKLRSWGLIFKNTTEPMQKGIDQGLFEIKEGTRKSSKGIYTYNTTMVTGKGQAYIIKRLLEEIE